MKDENESVRAGAIWALGKLAAKEHAKELIKLLGNSSGVLYYDEEKQDFVEGTISDIATKVLKDWGYKLGEKS